MALPTAGSTSRLGAIALAIALLPGCFKARTTPDTRTPAARQPHAPAARVTAPPARGASDRPAVETLVAEAAARFRVDEDLILAVIWVESRFRPDSKSPAGAVGLMQLMPATYTWLASELGEKANPRDPGFNIRAGTYYLRRLLDRFGGSETLALYAYVGGEGRVARWRSRNEAAPPAWRGYARRVLAAKEAFRRGDMPDAREQVPAVIELPPELDGREIEERIRRAEKAAAGPDNEAR